MRKKTKHKSRKRQHSRAKPLLLAVMLILCLGFIAFWAYAHPYEARQHCQSVFDTLYSFYPRPQQPPPVNEFGYDNLSLGIPGPADTIIDRPGYALGYIERHEQAAWVIYRLTVEELKTKVSSRSDDFRADPDIPTGSATPADYKRSGFDRGHLAPAADMAFSVQTMSDSFYMSNMSPQRPECNRKIWKDLETQVRHFALAERDVYIVTGPILPQRPSLTIGENKVTVPDAFYKIVYDRTPPQKMIAFIVPNAGSSEPLQSFVVTVDRVEEETGLDFFPLLPQPLQEELESTISIHAWAW